MAWPVTARFQDYVANVTRITAAALNAIQDAIIAVFAGTLTLKGLEVDGTGGASATAPAGTLKMSATKSGTTGGASQAVVLGTLYKDTVPIAWGTVANSGAASIVRSANIASVTRNSAGNVSVVLQNAPANHVSPVACLMSGATRGFITCVENALGTFTVRTWDNAGTLTDFDFSFVASGG